MKILLIEDNRAISKGLVYTLEQNGFEVALCENAESTLNSLGGDFDLFIVDVSLPDGNGFELCDEIKSQERKRCAHIFTLVHRMFTI